jgi:hypothetical protein
MPCGVDLKDEHPTRKEKNGKNGFIRKPEDMGSKLE